MRSLINEASFDAKRKSQGGNEDTSSSSRMERNVTTKNHTQHFSSAKKEENKDC